MGVAPDENNGLMDEGAGNGGTRDFEADAVEAAFKRLDQVVRPTGDGDHAAALTSGAIDGGGGGLEVGRRLQRQVNQGDRGAVVVGGRLKPDG